MSVFLLPCGLLIFAVWIGFFLCLWFTRNWYIAPLERRLARLEKRMQPAKSAQTQDFSTSRPRYKTVEQRGDSYAQ